MKLLLVEDEAPQRQLLLQYLEERKLDDCEAVGLAEEAIELLEQRSFDVVISDWKLPGKDGLELFEWLQTHSSDTAFILMTAYGNINHAIEAIRAGIDDYLTKPFDKTQLLFAIDKLRRTRDTEKENQQLKQSSSYRQGLQNIVGESKVMQQVFQHVEKVSDTDITVLIGGESGTGKELVARSIHQFSSRKNQTFLAVNCSAIPETLAEAELFGAEKGAYTGANQRKIGKIEAANGGTLFLDEIGELPLALQAKLLRFLQEKSIMRVGGTEEVSVDVRVIAATHRRLPERVASGEFREDLYYRLNVVPVELPPLRDRLDDLPALITYFTDLFANQHRCQPVTLTSAAKKAMFDYSWPGNIRELSNLIERLTVLSSGVPVDVSELPFQTRSPLTHQTTTSHSASMELNREFVLPDEGLCWEELEYSVLQQALEKTGGNRTKAAKLLGLNYKAFLYRLEKHAIQNRK